MAEIQLTRCTLRPWRADDLEELVGQANNRRVWRNLRDRFPHPYTREDAERWLAFAAAQSPQLNFCIEVASRPAGGIGLELRGDVDCRTAEIGYWLGEAYWRRGIATEAVGAFADWALATFDVARLEAGVFGWNPGSARVLEKAGFTCEARLRDAVFKDGELTDRLIYARLR
ncbi:MAG: GNAT family N-acetyltransferase [Pirellulales bacterium]|nr:GNAT family N-acetyltransferase [Pirellulales bacterium]